MLAYLFVNANPVQLARIVKWLGIGVVAIVVVLIVLSERFSFLWLPLVMGLPAWRRFRSMFAGFRGPSAGHTSQVETAFLSMSLDHDTGTMTATVRRGRFAGLRLEEMSRSSIITLLRECRAEDLDSARLVEAYLDRAHPDWRDDFAGARAGGAGDGRSGAGRASGDVSVDEAYAILGLPPGADAEAIKAAHHRLMKQVHPDRGGSDYLASKINRARDVLLGMR